MQEEGVRIVHGEEAAEGALPYQASLQLRVGDRLVSSKPAHFCGGAFIAEDWIGGHTEYLQINHKDGTTKNLTLHMSENDSFMLPYL